VEIIPMEKWIWTKIREKKVDVVILFETILLVLLKKNCCD